MCSSDIQEANRVLNYDLCTISKASQFQFLEDQSCLGSLKQVQKGQPFYLWTLLNP